MSQQNPHQPELVDRVHVYKDHAGEWRWTAYAGNNEPVANSGEGYVNHTHARDMAVDAFPGAELEDDGADEKEEES